MNVSEVVDQLKAQFADVAFDVHEYAGQTHLTVPRERAYEVLETLRRDAAFGFEQLVDLHGQDYLYYRGARDRFAVVYQLLNIERNVRIWIRVLLNEPDLTLQSVVPLWCGANWMEREVFDLLGIEFEGHPDLRRILLPYDFESHPLRKDYPLRGRGERHDLPRLAREDS